MAAHGLAVMAAVVAAMAAGAMVVERAWLGQRTIWGVGLVAVSLVALWWRPRGEVGAVLAAVLMVLAGLVVVTDLGRAAGHDFAGRVLADDLPPVAVYVAAIGLGLSIVACGVVAWLRLSRAAWPSGRRRTGWPRRTT